MVKIYDIVYLGDDSSKANERLNFENMEEAEVYAALTGMNFQITFVGNE